MTIWANTPLPDRIAFVARFRRAIIAAEHELCELVRGEVHKSRFEALTTDVVPLVAACKWLERNATRLLAPAVAGSSPFWMPGVRIKRFRAPVGRVAIIATWNYPLQLLGIELVQALIAGNTVVVKPSERSPASQLKLLQLAQSAGLPDETLTWTDADRNAGATLLAAERFDHVIFTGSTEVGRSIASTLASHLTPCTLELSGRDSAIVLDDGDPVLAAKSIWSAVTLNAGQSCIAPRRALVHDAVYEPFVAALTQLAKEATQRTLIDAAAADHCYNLVVAAIAAGGRDAAAGNQAPEATAPPPKPAGSTWRPTAVIDCPPTAALVEGRHFGPALAVVRVKRTEEAIAIHQACDQHLATSVFTATPSRVRRMAADLRATSLTVNDCIIPTAHPAVGIGGHGASGFGLSRGGEGLLSLTRPVYISVSNGLIRRSLKPPREFMVNLLAKGLRFVYGR